MTSYRAHATERALAKLRTRMPGDVYQRVCLEALKQGLTVKELVGRIAFRAGRLLDVELVAVPFFNPSVPHKEHTTERNQTTERTRT